MWLNIGKTYFSCVLELLAKIIKISQVTLTNHTQKKIVKKKTLTTHVEIIAQFIHFFNFYFFLWNLYFSIISLSDFEFLRGNWPFQYHKIVKKQGKKKPQLGALLTSFLSIFLWCSQSGDHAKADWGKFLLLTKYERGKKIKNKKSLYIFWYIHWTMFENLATF